MTDVSASRKFNRLMCGSCLDFNLMTTVPLDDFGLWEGNRFVPEKDFLENIMAIKVVSQVETQTITNVDPKSYYYDE